jgi:hypothetical protein
MKNYSEAKTAVLTDTKGFLISYLQAHDKSLTEWYNGYYYLDGDHNLFGIKVNSVLQEGGNEGGGENVEWVYSITDVDGIILKHFRLNGFYGSYSGIEWDEPSEIEIVEPREVTVIQYF